MFYQPDEFYRLVEAIEAEGGSLLEAIHEDSECDLPMDPSLPRKTPAIPHCNEMCVFELHYEPEGAHPTGTLATMEACAVDDWMGRWPRFAIANAPGHV